MCTAGSERFEYFSMFGTQGPCQTWSSSQFKKGLVCPVGDKASSNLKPYPLWESQIQMSLEIVLGFHLGPLWLLRNVLSLLHYYNLRKGRSAYPPQGRVLPTMRKLIHSLQKEAGKNTEELSASETSWPS